MTTTVELAPTNELLCEALLLGQADRINQLVLGLRQQGVEIDVSETYETLLSFTDDPTLATFERIQIQEISFDRMIAHGILPIDDDVAYAQGVDHYSKALVRHGLLWNPPPIDDMKDEASTLDNELTTALLYGDARRPAIAGTLMEIIEYLDAYPTEPMTQPLVVTQPQQPLAQA